MKRSLLNWATTLVVVGAMALPVMAGGGGGGGGGGRGGRGGGGGGGMGGGGAGGGGGGMMGGGGGGRGGFGAVDPATQIQNSLTNIQTQLGMQDGGEWDVLKAKIQKVLEDQQKLNAGAASPLGRGGFGGGRGGRGGAAAATPVDATNPLAVARDDLSKAVTTGTTTADADLKTKLTAVRDNVKKWSDTLTADQASLQKLCTVRQEAILVTLGVLN